MSWDFTYISIDFRATYTLNLNFDLEISSSERTWQTEDYYNIFKGFVIDIQRIITVKVVSY